MDMFYSIKRKQWVAERYKAEEERNVDPLYPYPNLYPT
jgi:hypothetical protein